MSICEGISKMTRQEFIQGYIDVNKSQIDTGKISDGFHTFDELYFHRTVLFACLCKANADKAFKSKKHSDGTMFDDMFIVGIFTPAGYYTYHCEMEYWDLFTSVTEVEFAPEWDGHKPEDVTRLLSIPHG